MAITQLYDAEKEGGEEKKKAAEYLSAQVYQLYEERREIVKENDLLKQQNSELQRLSCSQKIDLEKYTAYIRKDGCGPTASMIGKVEELQDLLIQQRQVTDVSKMVEKDTQIRGLQIELAKKTEQIGDMKNRLRQLMA